MLFKGDLVMHHRYGLGTVLRKRNRGFEVWVSFGRFRLWIRSKDLSRVSEGIKAVGNDSEELDGVWRPTKRTQQKTLQPTLSFGRKRSVNRMQIIESLRTGLVPKAEIESWTFGRDQEVSQVKAWLKDPGEGALLIEGNYGMGKSHLLAYLEHIAWKEGFAVAFTGYDPSEATAAFPKRFYRHLIETLRVPVGERMLDFRDFIVELANRGAKSFFAGHPYLSEFMNMLTSDPQAMDEANWEWLEGRDTYSREFGFLYDHRTAANIYCNLLSAFSAAMVEFLDLQGLLVLVDEAEVISSQRYRYQVEGAMNLMKGLSMVANDDEIFIEEDVVRTDNGYRGAESGLMYSGFMPNLRYIHSIPTHLKIAYALTPIMIPTFLEMREQMPVIPLSPLGARDITALFNKIVDTYKTVYDLALDRKWRKGLLNRVADLFPGGNLPLRSMVKATVEALDILRFYPTIGLEELFE